jgi:hypothetical protein
MVYEAKKSYLHAITLRYQSGNRAEKSKILDEFCAICNYNRKYAIRVLNRKITPRKSKSGPKPYYHDEAFVTALKQIWLAADQPCSLKLKAIIPLWLNFYEEKYGALESETKQKLLSISRPTIDRVLKPTRAAGRPRGLSGTKPGTLMKSQIPIQFTYWDVKSPGFLEADTVAHCGNSIAGQFAWSLTVTDICTGWTEIRALWNKKSSEIYKQISMIEASLPFKTLGFDSDNGGEFINHSLYDYFTNRDEPVIFTRPRPYKKNDNAHVEQKNWTHVRQLFGYDRLDSKAIVYWMNDLYRKEWSLYQNFFMPSTKLVCKERVGAKYKKKYDQPKTPFQRLLESSSVDDVTKDKLIAAHKTLNPSNLKADIEMKLEAIFKHVTVTSNVRHRI